MELTYVLIIAVSLSMDAFSLSLAYGTLNIEKRTRNMLSIIVGIYHFLMPLLGYMVGYKVVKLLPIKSTTLVLIVLSFIGVEMIIESFRQEKSTTLLGFRELLLFGFAVSIDSFSVGLGLNTIYSNILVPITTFSISSAFFTYLGLYLGTKISNIFGKISTLIGGIALIIIGILYTL